jgi:hypothetical protein
LDKGDFKVRGYYVTAAPEYSHHTDYFIKPCDCHDAIKYGIWLHSRCAIAEVLNDTRTHSVLHMVAV